MSNKCFFEIKERGEFVLADQLRQYLGHGGEGVTVYIKYDTWRPGQHDRKGAGVVAGTADGQKFLTASEVQDQKLTWIKVEVGSDGSRFFIYRERTIPALN